MKHCAIYYLTDDIIVDFPNAIVVDDVSIVNPDVAETNTLYYDGDNIMYCHEVMSTVADYEPWWVTHRPVLVLILVIVIASIIFSRLRPI